jgi:phosphoglycerate dehydrogenase-like enzyme
VIVAMRERTPIGADLLARLPRLRLLVTTGMANPSIDIAAAGARGIVVCGTGGLPSPTAELTWALVLALARHVCAEDRRMRDGGWQQSVGTELAGRTLGVIGLGRLGRRVAAVGQAFEMPVIAWSQNLVAAGARSLGVEPVPRDELLARADVVTLHLRLSDRTRGLIGRHELALMQRSALLVNTSRGPIVDEAALLEALHAGTIAGAALDVYDTEPLPPEHPLRSAPNTVLTPHLGYVTSGTYARFYGDAVEDVAAFLRGAPVRVLSPGPASSPGRA